MQELIDRNLDILIDPEGFRGCDKARLIAPNSGISRHAWGAALDINFGADRASRAQDPRLIEIMTRWGFTSGHAWLVPDPGHFEYARRPARGLRAAVNHKFALGP